MKVDVFTLCDFAQTDRQKMTIVGAFSVVYSRQAPVVHPLCSLAIKMRFERIEEGEKRIRISIIDSDGKPILPTLEAQLNIHFKPDDSVAMSHIALLIQQIKLPSFGEYSIDLAVDGRQEASTPLFVKQLPNPQQPQLPLQQGPPKL
jgi:hypothetical protein